MHSISHKEIRDIHIISSTHEWIETLVLNAKAENLPQLCYLGVVSCVLHPVAPVQMAVNKDPFATVLTVVTSLESTHSGSEHVWHALECTTQDAWLNVAGLLVAQIETARHAKFDVQLSSRIAVDGERCAGALLVASDGSWLTASDDSEGACWVDALEVFGREVFGELTYVVFAMLFTIVNMRRTHFIVATSATHTAEEVSYEHDDLSILCVV
jgi:hypothetical protein